MQKSTLSSAEFNKKYRLNKDSLERLIFAKNDGSGVSIAGKPKILAIEILKRFFTNPVVVISTIIFISLLITAFIVKYTSPYLAGYRVDAL
ncbi:UNVERIFIED_CONTAM: hypothetical protein O8I53_09615 [Campylobacter lari]